MKKTVPSLGRRQFLKILGVGAVAASASAMGLSTAVAQVLHGLAESAAELREILRPEDKQDDRKDDEQFRSAHTKDLHTFLQIRSCMRRNRT